MSMLELITKASASSDHLPSDSQYPIVLNADPILLNLKPQNQQPTDASFIQRVEGWKISQADSDIIELGQTFYKTLKIKLKNPNSFTKAEFITLLNSYLEKNNDKLGSLVVSGLSNDEGYTKSLLEKLGFLIGDAVLGLILEACFKFEIWEVIEALIVLGLVNGSGSVSDNLVRKLVERNRADLVCLCVKHVSNLQVSDMLLVLKFFLSPSKDAYSAMRVVRKEWEVQTVSVIETATDKSLAVLLMMAHDEFTTSELCLHYLVASANVDDVMFSVCVGKLSGVEIMRFVRYLKKWLVKYQKFPQVGSVSKGSSAHGVKVLESVPSLERVTKCFGLVIDEHFTSLVMHPEFREEVESIELVVNSLVAEARLCCNLANLCAGLNL
ncbi:uncharacterized protein LOC143564183 [Bidens hawaiensis]|uniref:uncharacterized protein LOC143564183 n=1 Tax=Bidens hawaiensis TaxID=980011 RepID=UPI004049E0DE